MRTYKKELEAIASDLLEQAAFNCDDDKKPNYSNRDFMNCVIIFQTALMDKMDDMQDFDKMSMYDRIVMAKRCGESLHKLIHTFTGLDIHKVEEFV